MNGCAVGRSAAAWRFTPAEGMGTVLAAGKANLSDLKGCEEARPRFGLPRKMSCACGLRPDMEWVICTSVLPFDTALLEGSLNDRVLLLSRLSPAPVELPWSSWPSMLDGSSCSGILSLERLAAGVAALTWTLSAPKLGGQTHVGGQLLVRLPAGLSTTCRP